MCFARPQAIIELVRSTWLRALDEVRTVVLEGKSEFRYKIAIPERLAEAV